MSGQKKVVLAHQPDGKICPGDFRVESAPKPVRESSQALLAVECLSMDPYLRGVIAGRHLGHAIEPGNQIPGLGLARVLAAPESGPVKPGDRVIADCGWCQHACLSADELTPLRFPEDIPETAALGILGMPGLAAWAGLNHLAQFRAGETVAVSAAGGTVGAAVIQLAAARGCRTIAITGTEKHDYVANELRADAVAFRDGDLADQLARHCPDGIDVYFDNVGGEVLKAVLARLALRARIVLCGMISQYQSDIPPPGPNLGPIIAARASLHGLVVYDHFGDMQRFRSEAIPLYREHRLRCRETRFEGIESAPDAFCALMNGETAGRVLVVIDQQENS